MARPKKPSVELQSIDECTRAMAELLLATTDVETLTAERDRAVAGASAKYEPRLDEARSRKLDLEARLKHYYMTHLEDLEKDGKRSVQLANGVMGRRLSPPKLALLNKSWTWAAVLVKLRSIFGDRFIRLRDPEVDKDLVKAELEPDRMKECGLKLDQDEIFFAEPERLPDPKGVKA